MIHGLHDDDNCCKFYYLSEVDNDVRSLFFLNL